ncbi:hypothetical protein [Azospirillum doebereinerae]
MFLTAGCKPPFGARLSQLRPRMTPDLAGAFLWNLGCPGDNLWIQAMAPKGYR